MKANRNQKERHHQGWQSNESGNYTGYSGLSSRNRRDNDYDEGTNTSYDTEGRGMRNMRSSDRGYDYNATNEGTYSDRENNNSYDDDQQYLGNSSPYSDWDNEDYSRSADRHRNDQIYYDGGTYGNYQYRPDYEAYQGGAGSGTNGYRPNEHRSNNQWGNNRNQGNNQRGNERQNSQYGSQGGSNHNQNAGYGTQWNNNNSNQWGNNRQGSSYGSQWDGNRGNSSFDSGNYANSQGGNRSYGSQWGNNNENDMHRGKGPKGYKRSDERVKEDVNDRLTDDGRLDASEIEVNVKDSEVTLTGTVDSRQAKRRAEDLVEAISGVQNVENRLRVKNEKESDTSSDTSSKNGKHNGTSDNTSKTGKNA